MFSPAARLASKRLLEIRRALRPSLAVGDSSPISSSVPFICSISNLFSDFQLASPPVAARSFSTALNYVSPLETPEYSINLSSFSSDPRWV
ncbi:hypothetical protein GW17_00028768 [Ensete ventricosum]|nr:hypothetical protein GW17_00028768 [Ensete ventricosum]